MRTAVALRIFLVAGTIVPLRAQQISLPVVPPLEPSVTAPSAPSSQLVREAAARSEPVHGEVHGLTPTFLGFFGPYRRTSVSPLFAGSQTRLQSLIREGKLYLSLHEAIVLTLENNLDIEIERSNLEQARTDETRAAGGGSLRGIDYTIELPPNGVGGPGSPLLNIATVNTNPTTPTVTDLTSLNSTTQQQQSLSQAATGSSYSAGPNIPIFDPELIGNAGYLRRSDIVSLTTDTTGASTASSGMSAQSGPLDYIVANVSYLQGFSTGLQVEAIVNNSSQVLYSSQSRLDPFYAPTTSTTLTQPLLRGRGRDVNLRYLHIAQTNRSISHLLFAQQVQETIYGTSRLYFDLVSLGENVLVKQESLRAAIKLREDDELQVKLGTLAPIELTRTQAVESSSRFDLVQAQGLYKQQEIILRNQLMQTASPAFTVQFAEIVPTDRILVPQTLKLASVPDLVTQALARRPDLAQAQLQVKAGEISVVAGRNNALPQLNLYANVETRGAAEQPYETLGSIGTGLPTTPQNLATGGLRTATIYQAGVQLTLPLRNRVAISDAARDTVQLRQVQARAEKFAATVQQDVETSVVALQTAQAAYEAAAQSRLYQSQLLQAERDKLSVGQSTELNVLQNQAYLAQALSTEIATRSNWQKARLELDRALGDLLENNHIMLDDAIRGKIPER